MLAYAAEKSAIGRRESSPNALLIIVGAHVAAIAALMSARMELPARQHEPPIIIETIPRPVPPKPIEQPRTALPSSQAPSHPTTTTVDPMDPRIAPHDPPSLLAGTSIGDPGPTIEPPPPFPPIQLDPPVKSGPKLITPASDLKPPYPASKILTEEEAVLTLRLTIDDRGHVIAVDPVGRADRVFVEAARRHLIAHWRYQPANENGRAIASSLVVTLRFLLAQ